MPDVQMTIEMRSANASSIQVEQATALNYLDAWRTRKATMTRTGQAGEQETFVADGFEVGDHAHAKPIRFAAEFADVVAVYLRPAPDPDA